MQNGSHWVQGIGEGKTLGFVRYSVPSPNPKMPRKASLGGGLCAHAGVHNWQRAFPHLPSLYAFAHWFPRILRDKTEGGRLFSRSLKIKIWNRSYVSSNSTYHVWCWRPQKNAWRMKGQKKKGWGGVLAGNWWRILSQEREFKGA